MTVATELPVPLALEDGYPDGSDNASQLSFA
jgi:hypothetical protein